MLTLNALGQDAAEALAAGPITHYADAAWLRPDRLLVIHPNGNLYRVDPLTGTTYELLHRATDSLPLLALRAGGGSWSGQCVNPATSTPFVVGDLAPAPNVPEAARFVSTPSDPASAHFIADVARETGTVLTVEMAADGRTILQIDAPTRLPVTRITVAGSLVRPPRLSPCGTYVSWVESDGRALYALAVGGGVGPLRLPGARPLLTPKLFEFFDVWWVLAHTVEAGLTLTRLHDWNGTHGYQWAPANATDLDAYLTDQVYVAWETEKLSDQAIAAGHGAGPLVRHVARSEGFAPGLDEVPLIAQAPDGSSVELRALSDTTPPDMDPRLHATNGAGEPLPDPTPAQIDALERELESDARASEILGEAASIPPRRRRGPARLSTDLARVLDAIGELQRQIDEIHAVLASSSQIIEAQQKARAHIDRQFDRERHARYYLDLPFLRWIRLRRY